MTDSVKGLADELEKTLKRAGEEWAYYSLIERTVKFLRAKDTPADLVSVGEREWIAPIVTIADLVNNLLTLDQAMEVHGAYFIDHPAVEDRCRTRKLSISRERVANNRVQTNNEALPWSIVIWTAQEREAKQPQSPQREE